jgi:hypothetical protein
METIKVPPRSLLRTLAILGSCIMLAAIAVAIVVATTPSANAPRRLGPAVAEPMTGTTAPAWSTDAPHPTVIPTLSQQDTRALTSMPWKFIALTDGRDLDLQYAAGDGDCTLPEGFAATYSKTSVEVWALSKTDWSRTACANPLVRGVATVRLREPLGGRTLVHAPTGELWPSSLLD